MFRNVMGMKRVITTFAVEAGVSQTTICPMLSG